MTQSSPSSLLLAHQTKISGEVGGTQHIEPNDTPRAGETVTAWFALTQKGGNSIPLDDCDCNVAVYQVPQREGDEAIATPNLTAIDVEGQTDVPAADIVFPNVGAYELVISGSAQGSADFSPFELRFPITVAAGSKTKPTGSDASSTESSQASTKQTETQAEQASENGSANGAATEVSTEPVDPAPVGTFPVGIVSGIAIAIIALAALALIRQRGQ